MFKLIAVVTLLLGGQPIAGDPETLTFNRIFDTVEQCEGVRQGAIGAGALEQLEAVIYGNVFEEGVVDGATIETKCIPLED